VLHRTPAYWEAQYTVSLTLETDPAKSSSLGNFGENKSSVFSRTRTWVELYESAALTS
jgi:hypothetical protein